MRYTLISLKPTPDGYRLRIEEMREQAFQHRPEPNQLGFYWCPEDVPIAEGVERLRACIIQALQERRRQIEEQIEDLRTIPNPYSRNGTGPDHEKEVRSDAGR